MDITTKLIYMGTDLVLPLALGYYCRQRQWLSEALCNKIIDVNITLFCTILATLSFWILPLDPALLWLPVFGLLLSFIPGLAGYWKHYYSSILSILPVKFLITPLAGYFIASHLFTDPVVLGTILIAASAPAGINAVVLPVCTILMST